MISDTAVNTRTARKHEKQEITTPTRRYCRFRSSYARQDTASTTVLHDVVCVLHEMVAIFHRTATRPVSSHGTGIIPGIHTIIQIVRPHRKRPATLDTIVITYILCAPPGPELRKGLGLYRVANHTGLQVREEIGLGSKPCGRLSPGDVFCTNRSLILPHGTRRLVRLHVVQPLVGWVTGVPKWVERFQDSGRPGPIPLGSTLTEKSVVLMRAEEGCRDTSPRMDAEVSGHGCASQTREQGFGASTPRTRWLHSR